MSSQKLNHHHDQFSEESSVVDFKTPLEYNFKRNAQQAAQGSLLLKVES